MYRGAKICGKYEEISEKYEGIRRKFEEICGKYEEVYRIYGKVQDYSERIDMGGGGGTERNFTRH